MQPGSKEEKGSSKNMICNGGELGELIRNFDWSSTSLGPIGTWPQSLVTSVNIVLQSPVPLVMLWGSDGIMIYNDAYSVFAGARHPFLLGKKVVEGWPEVADFNRNVMAHGLGGKTLSYKDQQLTLYRNNVAEEVWMDLNYSPIISEEGLPAGVLAIVVETTGRVFAEQKQQQAEKAAQAEKQKLYDLFMKAPAAIVILTGPDLVFQLANEPYRNMVGRDRPLVGKPLAEALPDLDPALVEVAKKVAFQGEHFIANELPMTMDWEYNGSTYTKYMNFIYEPVFEDGKPNGVMGFGFDVSDLVYARQQTEASETQLRIALDQKDEFISIASHELKTPLTSIKAYMQLLERQIQDEKQKAYVRKTNDYVNKLQSLVSALLDVSKIQAGKLQYEFSEFNFEEMVDEAIESVAHTHSTHRITKKGSLDVTVKGDRLRLEQVVTNYLTNAIKYSPRADEVMVDLSFQNDEIVVAVKDLGIGIPKDKQQNLFERFYRAETSHRFTGLGIGLYIASEIVKTHKGRVWVESEEGKGSTFYFAIPLR